MTAPPATPTVGWKVASLSFGMASVRYRAMLPLLALEQDGFKCRVFSDAGSEQLVGLDLLVIVKSFSAEDFTLAQQAVRLGVPVVLDLCDNIFISSYGTSALEPRTSPAQMFLAMARLASCVVVTTEPLAQVVRRQLDIPAPVYVIPDGLETHDVVELMRGRLAEAIMGQRKSLAEKIRKRVIWLVGRAQTLRSAAMVPLTKRLADRAVRELHWKPWAKRAYRRFESVRRSVRARTAQARDAAAAAQRVVNPDAKRVLWFGNHGAPHARFGMLDLLEIREALEAIASEFNVELVVVSNHRGKYERHIAPLRIPSTYVEWSPASIKRQLALASVVVVPNTLDAFSVCKSSNRTASALLAGVPVVATATPALDALAGSVVLDDFLGGLRLYLSDARRAAADVARGRELIQRTYGQAAIAAAWAGVTRVPAKMHGQPARSDAQLVVVLHLIQDLDLALPVLLAARQRRVTAVAWCSTSLLEKSPRVVRSLADHNIAIEPVADDMGGSFPIEFPPSATILLTVAESNLGPHRFTRNLTNIAKSAGLLTATMQHGFENVGLTYDDDIHPADRIDFAADRIYLWGERSTLHRRVPAETRDKCIPVGCPKPARFPMADLSTLLPNDNQLIGVFENLHWHRYSDEYREFFIFGIQELARVFPDINFLVKPHHAGKWLTGKRGMFSKELNNLIIADPADPDWEQHTASGLIGRMSAVISTPSTVILDAARAGVPVAVVEHGMKLEKYSPLFKIRTKQEWPGFIAALDDTLQRQNLIELSSQFVGAAILAGDGAQHLVDDLRSGLVGVQNARR